MVDLKVRHGLGLFVSLFLVPGATALEATTSPERSIPDFSSFAVQERKAQFTEFMRELVQEENLELLKTRERIKEILASLVAKKTINEIEQKWLNQLAYSYKVKGFDAKNSIHLEKLMAKIDIVPVGLAIAQSANESAWGTSRFATDGANFFGQWCFRKGCGLVPKRKKDGLHYEVRKFENPQLSVKAYIHNLNVHPAFSEFRSLRYQMRKKKTPLSAQELASGLYRYSERGQAYVSDLKKIIRSNQATLMGI